MSKEIEAVQPIQVVETEEVTVFPEEEAKQANEGQLNNGILIYTSEEGRVYHQIIGEISLKDLVFYAEYLTHFKDDVWKSTERE